MTTARRERKPLRCWAILASVLVSLAVGPLQAATTERIVANRFTGLAIDGFDPVAYFTDAAPRLGRAELEYRFAGVAWRFHNEGNRAAFTASPDTYAPRFGGYDPTALARGAPVAGHPEIWLVVAQRLYLFRSAAARDEFARAPAAVAEAAERHWGEVRRTLVRD